MQKAWTVFRTEIINTLTRRSFLLTLILVPLVPAIILGVMSLFGGGENQSDGLSSIFQSSQEDTIQDGYVDLAGIIEQVPPDIAEDRLLAYQSEESAREAAVANEIQGYFLIQADFIKTGQISYYRKDFNPLSALEITGIIDLVIRYNLLEGDLDQFEAFSNPVQINRIDLSPEVEVRDSSNPMAFYLPYGVSMLFYVIIITSASLLMSSIAKEKENRVMEILMSSVKPIHLFTGKILGLGVVGLLQMVLWLGSALLMLRLGGTTLNIPQNLQLSPGILLWGIIFFILGYLVYASIMAGIGAFVTNLKEASQATFYVIMPLLIPMLLVSVIIEKPNAILPTVLSLIPFTAPTTILTRMAVSPVPLWQLFAAIATLVITIYLLIRAVAGMFRAQLLLTGKKFNLRVYIRTLLGQVSE